MGKTESIDEFLARGGSVKKLETKSSDSALDSRYLQRDLDNNEHGMSARIRVDAYKKRSGGQLPKDIKMYLKFRKRFGL